MLTKSLNLLQLEILNFNSFEWENCWVSKKNSFYLVSMKNIIKFIILNLSFASFIKYPLIKPKENWWATCNLIRNSTIPLSSLITPYRHPPRNLTASSDVSVYSPLIPAEIDDHNRISGEMRPLSLGLVRLSSAQLGRGFPPLACQNVWR